MNEAVLDSPKEIAITAAPSRPVLSRKFVFALTVLLGCFAGLGPLAIDMYLPSFPRLQNNSARRFHKWNELSLRICLAWLSDNFSMGPRPIALVASARSMSVLPCFYSHPSDVHLPRAFPR